MQLHGSFSQITDIYPNRDTNPSVSRIFSYCLCTGQNKRRKMKIVLETVQWCKRILRQLKAVKFFVLYVVFRLRTAHFSPRSLSLSEVLLTFTAHINYVRLNTSIFFLPEVDRVCIRKSAIRVNDKTTVSFVYILSSVVISVVIELLFSDENERDFLSVS